LVNVGRGAGDADETGTDAGIFRFASSRLRCEGSIDPAFLAESVAKATASAGKP
jgi:hypothetical protein